MNQQLDAFWSIPASELLDRVQAKPQGLTNSEAAARQKRYGSNLLKPKKKSGNLTLLIGQFKSPIMIIPLFAAGLSFWPRTPKQVAALCRFHQVAASEICTPTVARKKAIAPQRVTLFDRANCYSN